MTTTSPSEQPPSSATPDPALVKHGDPYAEFDEGELAIQTLTKFLAERRAKAGVGPAPGLIPVPGLGLVPANDGETSLSLGISIAYFAPETVNRRLARPSELATENLLPIDSKPHEGFLRARRRLVNFFK